MALSKELRLRIKKFLIANPIDSSSNDKYGMAAQHFEVEREQVRSIYRRMIGRNNSNLKNQYPLKPEDCFRPELQSDRVQTSDSLNITINTNIEVKSLESLLDVCDVDSETWEVVSWACKKWDLGIKNKAEQIETKALYSVSAKFRLRKIETDLVLQKELLARELFELAPHFDVVENFHNFKQSIEDNIVEREKNCLLELCLFDAHFGKLAHAEESGKDEDIKTVSQKYTEAIKDLISRVNINSVERILLPIGNDMINIDSSSGLTTAGTPQTSDSRYYKIVRTVKELLIKTINELLAIAPVDVVVVKGNHDSDTMFMIGEMIDSYYHNTKLVTVDNTPTYRKYYQYGNTAIQLTHGNEEPHQSLGLIFATEKPELWADTKFRYAQIGHFHKSKKLNYVSVDSYQGFSVQIIPSLSANDSWHAKKGYQSLKQAKGFLIDFNDGIIAELTHTSNL
jgi:hypothetical protein